MEKKDYALDLLESKLGLWRGLYLHWEEQMNGPNGPFKEGAEMMDNALEKIHSLEKAISTLTK